MCVPGETGLEGRTPARRLHSSRRAVDCVIAQICMDLDAELLSPDTDFELIARHTSLRLWRMA